MLERISVNPNIHSGKPTVAGTEIKVQQVLELVSREISFKEIIQDYYPELKIEDIHACIHYAIRSITIPTDSLLLNDIEKIEVMKKHESRIVSFWWCWFGIIIVISVSLLILNFQMGWIKDFGSAIGNTFIALLAYLPLMHVFKRKDVIKALNIIKGRLSQISHNDPEAIKLKSFLDTRLQKMLES